MKKYDFMLKVKRKWERGKERRKANGFCDLSTENFPSAPKLHFPGFPFSFPFLPFPFPFDLTLKKVALCVLDVRHVLLWPVHHSSDGCILHVHRPAVQRLLLEVIQHIRLILARHWVGSAGPQCLEFS